MKNLLICLLFLPVFAYSQTIKGSFPVVCADLEEFAKALEDFEEIPLLTGMSVREFENESPFSTALVVFANGKTGTFTIAEKFNDKICIVTMGKNFKPYIDEETPSYKKDGM
jgi:hypothetical protein